MVRITYKERWLLYGMADFLKRKAYNFDMDIINV